MSKIRWGILATGNIAHSVTQDLLKAEHSEVLAVASRSQERSDAFAKTYQIKKSYADYESLFTDDDIDIIYIATPHHAHWPNLVRAIEFGKHVLCEKPLTLNEKQAAECFALAAQKNVFLMEALWMRFFPALHQVESWLKEGLVGQVRSYQASFCFDLPYDPEHRLFNPNLAGGALLDLGIYPLSLATWLFGKPDSINGTAELSDAGIDLSNHFVLEYPEGLTADCYSSTQREEPMTALIKGDKGEIRIDAPFFCPTSVSLWREGDCIQVIDIPHNGNGYGYEIAEVEACLLANKTKSDLHTPLQTLLNLRLMDQLRAKWQLTYPQEN